MFTQYPFRQEIWSLSTMIFFKKKYVIDSYSFMLSFLFGSWHGFDDSLQDGKYPETSWEQCPVKVKPQSFSAFKVSSCYALNGRRNFSHLLALRLPSVSACVQVLVTNLAELLLQQAPLLQVGFAELLFVSNEQCQFANGAIQHILRTLLHQLTKSIRLTDQHSPRLIRKRLDE